MKRLATALAALVALLIAPVMSDALAGMAARACASAPCCVNGAHACPMHQNGAQPSCRAHSCWDDRSAAQTPPAVPAVNMAITYMPARANVTPRPAAALLPYDITPPEPPPPAPPCLVRLDPD